MENIFKPLKKALASHKIGKRLKECKHGFELSDVLDIQKDPECNKCGMLLSELPIA